MARHGGPGAPVLIAVIAVAAVAAQGCSAAGASHPAGGGSSQQPAITLVSPPPNVPLSGTRICGQPILHSPYSYHGPALTSAHSGTPAGLPSFGKAGTAFPADTRIVVIPPGDATAQAAGGSFEADRTIFYFEPGRHTVQQSMYTGDKSVYIGGYTPGAGVAVIDGVNGAALPGAGGSKLSVSRAGVANADQTWEYLTIENFTSSGNDGVMGDVGGGQFDNGNTYKFDTIGPNEYGYAGTAPPRTGESSGGGYAIGMGSETLIEDDCLTGNAQGAFNGSGTGIVISHNEISRNGLGEYPDNGGKGASPYGCGCSGGGKLFFSVNPVITYNYVHDNYNVGIWLDFDNTGADISDNYIASNWSYGIEYEASYNANISDNTLVGNGWASDGAWPAGFRGGACYGGVSCTGGVGPVTGAGGGFPYAAIYLPNSGGNGNLQAVKSSYSGELLVHGNYLLDNFGGVSVYTDTNRYPGNVDGDSACSVPLGALNVSDSSIYYRQTQELTTATDATVSGTSVTSSGGTQPLCSDYGASQRTESNSSQGGGTRAPSPGMAVFNVNTGALVGVVASATSAHAFRLRNPAPGASHVSLLLSAYGGCGSADYYGGRLGARSGSPAAYYWDNCIWGSRHVTVSGNTFEMHAYRVAGCSTANKCGFMDAMAFNAGVPTLMQYFDTYQNLIGRASGGLGNVWSGNTYGWQGSAASGGWQFMAGQQGVEVSVGQWRSAPNGQDAGSTFSP